MVSLLNTNFPLTSFGFPHMAAVILCQHFDKSSYNIMLLYMWTSVDYTVKCYGVVILQEADVLESLICLCSSEGFTKLWSSLAVSLVNLVVMMMLMVRVFVYGEPVVRRRSQAADSFWRHRKQADQDLNKVRGRKEWYCWYSCFIIICSLFRFQSWLFYYGDRFFIT